MIFVMKRKTFTKKSKKLLTGSDYLIIDGSDPGESVSTSYSKALNNKYNNVYTNSMFAPPKSLLKALTETKDGEPSKMNARKIEGRVEEFIKGEEMTISLVSTVNSMFAFEDPKSVNIFIVLPNKVYNVLGEAIIKRFRKLFNTDFKFIYSDKEIQEKKKLVNKTLKKKQLKELKKLIEKNVDKYNLKESSTKKKKKKKDKDGKGKEKKKHTNCNGKCKSCANRDNCSKKKKKKKKSELDKYIK
jgi:hypothetical protein